MVGKTLEELGIGHFYADYDPEEENGIYFIIDKPDNLFSWDQVGWKTALSDDSAAGSSDSTLRVDQFDYGQVVAEQSSHKISILTGGSTLSCKALPALVTHEGCSMTLATTKDPPRSGFKDERGQPCVAAFYPHKSGGFLAEMAGGWMRKVIAPCFEMTINERGEHVLGLGDGLGAHMSPEMVGACIEVGIDVQLRACATLEPPYTAGRSQALPALQGNFTQQNRFSDWPEYPERQGCPAH
jgi:hypothetical protein